VAHAASPTPAASPEVGALRTILARQPAVEHGDRQPKLRSDLRRWQTTGEEPLRGLYFAVRHQASTTALIPCCRAFTSPAGCADPPGKRRRGQAAEPARLACPAPVPQWPPRSRPLVASRTGHEPQLPGCPVAGTVSRTADGGRPGLITPFGHATWWCPSARWPTRTHMSTGVSLQPCVCRRSSRILLA
jgi:hypothetical protein